MYRHLDIDRIQGTAEQLNRRIGERFPGSGLGRVAAELIVVGEQTRDRVCRMRSPLWHIRIVTGAAIALLAAALAGGIRFAWRAAEGVPAVADLLQGLDAAVNEAILFGAAIFFLLRLERRAQRRIALRGLHELRSIAHVIDAHQLTKDPKAMLSPEATDTPSSPARRMSRYELARYLDYCSELLSVVAKLAALYAQCDDDATVLNGVNDVETLTSGLSNKIWQKMAILEAAAPGLPSARRSPAPA